MSSSQLGVRVGILADTNVAIAEIRALVQSSVHSVSFARVISADIDYSKTDVDVWIFASQECAEAEYLSFLDYVDQASAPVIYDDFSYLTAENRSSSASALAQKLTASCEKQNSKQRAQDVWVLAASAGGPEALSEFFTQLNIACGATLAEHAIVSNTALIVAQHISTDALPSLIQTIERTSAMPVLLCDQAHSLSGACVYIVHPELQVEFNDYGTVTPVNIAWQGAFSPTIDQVMARVARTYRGRSGAIIFSGMSDDGAASCRYMRNLGGTIWAQSPESAAIDSMPASAIKTREVLLSATPKVLAERFLARTTSHRFMFNKQVQGHA